MRGVHSAGFGLAIADRKQKNSASRPANIKEISPNQRGANVVQVRVLFIWCIHIVLSEDVGKRYSRKSGRL
ncbi:hypothetical protein YPD27_0258 [Yersinia pestis KIM D27]|nr:hypothetical protein YPD27_0258 [Yersinia pestis KIM D27]